MHTRLVSGRAQILTRRDNDWTDKYPAIAKFIAGLPAHNAYLDGELCGVLPDGRTAFNLIQNATDTGEGSLVFFLFDLLHLDGEAVKAFVGVRPAHDQPANRLFKLLTRRRPFERLRVGGAERPPDRDRLFDTLRVREMPPLAGGEVAVAETGMAFEVARPLRRAVPRKIGGRADAMIAIGSDRPRSESSHPPASVRSLW